MNDELDPIRAAFRKESSPLPRDAARDDAISVAVQEFRTHHQMRAQGTAVGGRLMNRVKGYIERSLSMQSIKLSHALIAGSSIAVLGLVIIGSSHQPLLNAGFGRQDPVGVPAISESKTMADQNVPVDRERDETAEEEIAPAPLAAPPAVRRETVKAKQVAPQTVAGSSPANLALQDQPSLAEGYAAVPAEDALQLPSYHDQGRDRFSEIKINPVKVAAEEPVSTFSIDVDTASYSFVRKALNNNVLPQKDAVRVEEMINYFPYDYPPPADRSEPFKATVTLMPTPWNPATQLMHVGVKGFSLNGQEKPRSNLVFLIDTSGSMDEPDKLPLLRNSLKLLTDSLGPEDTVSIVVYAGSVGTVLPPTKVAEKAKILAALDNLSAGGSTAGAEGIRQAYLLAKQNFDKAGVNRVILATDGDFNVGITDPEELKSFVERERNSGVYLSVLGFGTGNYNDELMQTLAQNGNGQAAYIDTLNEARKVLVEEATSMLFPIANDVKIQVEFNPQTVSEYRLIGYETRMLNREDFNNDKVDAGEIGAGHTVTAIYEVTPRNSSAALVDPLRYGQAESPRATGGETAFVKIRYKLPGEMESRLITQPVTAANALPSKEAEFAAAVAGFGQILRGGQYTKSYSYDDVIALAQGAKGEDPFGYRAEFINLVRMAKTAQALEPLRP
jgi:Ca-activated chloride channel family protein